MRGVAYSVAINQMNEETGKALLERINKMLQSAISAGDYKEIGRLAKMAEDLAVLEDQERQIVERRKNMAALIQEQGSESVREDHSVEPSPRERGNRVRSHYVDVVLAQDGIQLRRVTAKKYRTPAGLAAGITYAKELKVRSDSWFLGLADEAYDIVILLCDSFYEETVAFIFPPEFVKQIWRALSRSAGQVKFHVTRAGTTFNLRLPGRQLRPINQYLNATNVLR